MQSGYSLIVTKVDGRVFKSIFKYSFSAHFSHRYSYSRQHQQVNIRFQKHRFNVVKVVLRCSSHHLLHLHHVIHLLGHLSLEEAVGFERQSERKRGQRVINGNEMLFHEKEFIHLGIGSECVGLVINIV